MKLNWLSLVIKILPSLGIKLQLSIPNRTSAIVAYGFQLSCLTADLQGECIDAWLNNKLQNRCYGNFGHEQCSAMGCIPNSGIHTLTETCAEGNAMVEV